MNRPFVFLSLTDIFMQYIIHYLWVYIIIYFWSATFERNVYKQSKYFLQKDVC